LGPKIQWGGEANQAAVNLWTDDIIMGLLRPHPNEKRENGLFQRNDQMGKIWETKPIIIGQKSKGVGIFIEKNN